ncbi:MAG TPA: hypothetical protein ENL06_03390 [Candidatus Portnoybacteria bacterium]|nr:hypothetical protein [Candidatus Portnoybacteria bacterium]
MWDKINKILKNNGGVCVIVEDGEVKSVLLSFEQYEKLVDHKSKKDNQTEVNNKTQEKARKDNFDRSNEEETQLDNEMTPLAEDEVIEKMKEKLDQWRENQDGNSEEEYRPVSENISKEQEQNDNMSNEDKKESDNKEISLNDLPIE